jgi:hypothetical protein
MTVNIGFPMAIDFSVKVSAFSNITDIRLYYTISRQSYAQVFVEAIPDFEPGSSLEVTYNLDLRQSGGLPPGAQINYWWTFQDAIGIKKQSEIESIEFVDSRYDWQSIKEEQVTIYWYDGTQSFAQEIMTTTQEALINLAENTGAELSSPVKIYVYSSASDLQGAMVFPQEWTGGVAYTKYNIIAIGIPVWNLDWGKRAAVHELAHLVTYQMTSNPSSEIPTWLNEGLSTYAEGEISNEYKGYLSKAILENDLISVRSLASPFPADAAKARLAYAESYSIVDFLIQEYGPDKMKKLLDTFTYCMDYDAALESVYGFDMDGLNYIWQQSLVLPEGVIVENTYEINPGLAILIVFVVGSSLIIGFWLWYRPVGSRDLR